MSRYSNGFIAGLFTGALAGTIVGFLYAPDKGKNTRNRLSFRLNSYLEELELVVEKLQKEKENIHSDAKDRGVKVVAEAQQQADHLIQEAEDLIKSIKKVPVENKSE